METIFIQLAAYKDPLLISTIQGRSHTSYIFLLVWGLGEVGALTFGLYTHISKFININYGISIILIIMISLVQLRNKFV